MKLESTDHLAHFGDFDDQSGDRTVVEHLTVKHEGDKEELPAQKTVVCLRSISGFELGKLSILFPGEMILGRSEEADFYLSDRKCSRKHARLVVSGKQRCFVNDLGSTNGVYINGRRIEKLEEVVKGDELRFSNGNQFMIEHHSLADAQKQQDLYFEANTDKLTRTYNRRFLDSFYAYISRLAEQSEEYRLPYVMLLFDVDFFKKVNDTYGHIGGDDVLVELPKRLKSVLRTEDILARVGGEEFVVFAQINDMEQTLPFAERVRKAIEKDSIPSQGQNIAVTISIGALFIPDVSRHNYLELYDLADKALYKSKENGRNQVTLAKA